MIPFSEDSLKLQCLRISAFLWYSGSNTGSSEISGCPFCFRENELLVEGLQLGRCWCVFL